METTLKTAAYPERISFAHMPGILSLPGLIGVQLDSFEWFKQEGLREVFAEISPIEDFSGNNLSLELIVPPEPFGTPNSSDEECRDHDTPIARSTSTCPRMTTASLDASSEA